jgi:hypothetical protein
LGAAAQPWSTSTSAGEPAAIHHILSHPARMSNDPCSWRRSRPRTMATARGPYRRSAMITTTNVCSPAPENLGSKLVDGRDLAREQNQVRGCPGCALVIHMGGSRQQVDRARTTVISSDRGDRLVFQRFPRGRHVNAVTADARSGACLRGCSGWAQGLAAALAQS